VHVLPAGQMWPALVPVQSPVAPQNALLVVGWMHASSPLTLSWHKSSCEGHAAMHTPLEHVLAPTHAWPALVPRQSAVAPQWSVFDSGLMHWPPHSTSPGVVHNVIPLLEEMPLDDALLLLPLALLDEETARDDPPLWPEPDKPLEPALVVELVFPSELDEPGVLLPCEPTFPWLELCVPPGPPTPPSVSVT